MKNLILALLIFSFASISAQEKDYKPESEQIYLDIRNGEFGKVTARFDTSVSNKIDSVKLKQVWENLIKVAGPFVKVTEINSDHQPNYDVVIQKSQFEKRKIDFKLVFGTNQKVKGLSFLPGEPKVQYKAPDYYNADLITERPVILQNGPYRLPGVLTTPNKPGKFPLVVLVHGSGPNDKDETVGPMKIFKDLASGLAANGIAVYRFDKRSRIYAAKVLKDKSMTVNEETVEDAIAAVNLLKGDSTIDSTSVFIAGHGLGGMVLPLISSKTNVKGLIYMTVNSRPLSETIYDQTSYIISLDTSGEDRKPLMDSVEKQMQIIRSLKKPTTDTSYYFRLPAGYWAYLNSYDHVAAAKNAKKPLLILHGGRDYQIPLKDFESWKTALKDVDATFKIYPELNHFFIKGEGESRPSEYSKGGNVDIRVINDIAIWLSGKAKK